MLQSRQGQSATSWLRVSLTIYIIQITQDLYLQPCRYSIRVGRSQSVRGPFIDKDGKDLVNGGGSIVYGSNGETYAPGGQGVIRVGETDVLYYHYREFIPLSQARQSS